MSNLRLRLILNPEDKNDLQSNATAPKGERVFMRIFVENISSSAVAFDHISAEIYANYGRDVLALAPSDCPHAGDLVDIGENVMCSVSSRDTVSGGLKDDNDPSNGTQLDLVQTLVPGNQIGGFRLGTGKAGLQARDRPFVLQPGQMIQVADGRSRTTGMVATEIGSTPVISLGFASINGVPISVDPAYAIATVIDMEGKGEEDIVVEEK